jgi:plasmid stabilization system protein ParE
VRRFVLTRSAERDLDKIKSYLIGKTGPTITRRVMKEIRTALNLIGVTPPNPVLRLNGIKHH